jgi:hypothetical protein
MTTLPKSQSAGSSVKPKMEKRVEKKEDGRTIIFYTFAPSTTTDAPKKS